MIYLPICAEEESSWPKPRLWPIAWARLLARMWGSNGFTSTLIPTDLSVQIRPTLAVVVSPLEKEFLPLKLETLSSSNCQNHYFPMIYFCCLILFMEDASNVRYDIIGIYLAFPGQLSNTTEIELLETKLDPYIWFTALLSEFFQRYELYILTWTSGWCLSQYCEAFSGHRSSNHQELYLSPAVLKFLQPGLDPPMFPDKLLTASFSERFWNTEKG